METVLWGTKGRVCITPDRPTVLIGKFASSSVRAHTARKSTKNYVEIAKNEALAQVAAGADIVNVGIRATDVDHAALLAKVITAVQEVVEIPICIEAPDRITLAAALAVCRGKPLVNAIHGGPQTLTRILPLVAEHKAAVIGRCEDEQGIPNDPYGRLEIAHKIIERAESLGIPREDVLIDGLTQPIETDPEAALITLETVRLVKAELDANMTLDISTVSAKLPNSVSLYKALLNIAVKEGVNAPMVNAAQDRQAILALDVVLGRDNAMSRHIQYYHYRRSGMRGLVDWELIGGG